MSTWLPSSSWSRKRSNVSRQLQIVRRKKRKFTTPAKAAHAGTHPAPDVLPSRGDRVRTKLA